MSDTTNGREDEVRVIRSHRIATLQSWSGAARLVRQARNEWPCDEHGHVGDAPIARGEVYIEELANGSHNSGLRYCLACALRIGIATDSAEEKGLGA